MIVHDLDQTLATVRRMVARFGIRVNALASGYISTELDDDFWRTEAGKALIGRVPIRRRGQVEEPDGSLLLLASDASRCVFIGLQRDNNFDPQRGAETLCRTTRR